ncbi:MAG: CpXC domain-containing protein [Nanoarchaeota archaeon]|nr:CpXC domain-containing protein [Nanoarchaeota archaeon]
MKCPNCNKEIKIQVATKINCEKCRILTAATSIITAQCEHCGHIFQVPVQSKRLFSVKKDR